MSNNWFKIFLLVLLATIGSVTESAAQNEKGHIEVALRMIGHQLLLNANDSTSRVLPIKSEKEKFRINFATAFGFSPDDMISSVDSIFEVAKIDERYRLEVEDVDLQEIVYSYETGPADSVIPCRQRGQPEGNYSILLSFLNENGQTVLFEEEPTENNSVSQQSGSSTAFVSILILLALLLAIGVYFWRIKNRSKSESGISIGKYRFDQRNMKLIFKKESIDLTSKESDLLTLLHSSMDVTIEREEILKVVWGDEGDYVGRTLDVFISKLRKKFSEDENVKIVNVRGVGYKLMLSQVN